MSHPSGAAPTFSMKRYTVCWGWWCITNIMSVQQCVEVLRHAHGHIHLQEACLSVCISLHEIVAVRFTCL